MRTALLLLLSLLCLQIGVAPVFAQGCDQVSFAGACSDGCQDDQESDADDQCGSCACCRVNEPLSPLVLFVSFPLPAFPVATHAESVGPSPCPADIFRPPRTA